MTELDYTVLALIARDGPLSAYDVRKDFANSLTPTWSSSTGSIYPSIHRLADAKLIRASAPAGARGKQKLTITVAGQHALSEWLSTVTIDVAAPTPDPVRTRAHFLPLLDRKARRVFLADAIASTSAAIEVAEARKEERIAAGATKEAYLPGIGVLYELRARKEWLELLMRELT